MVQYRRNRVAGGTYFFTVALADRRSEVLTAHADLLRQAFRAARNRRPFTVQAGVAAQSGRTTDVGRIVRLDIVQLNHPCWDVSPAMQYPPNIDVIIPYNIENEVWIALEGPEPQAWQVKFVGVALRPCRRVVADVCVGILQCLNEPRRGLFSPFNQVMVDCLIYILIGYGARANGLELHPSRDREMRSRNALKYVSSATSAVGEAAPSSNKPLSR